MRSLLLLTRRLQIPAKKDLGVSNLSFIARVICGGTKKSVDCIVGVGVDNSPVVNSRAIVIMENSEDFLSPEFLSEDKRQAVEETSSSSTKTAAAQQENCEDISTNNVVVVEEEMDSSESDHLGSSVTHSGNEPVAVAGISSKWEEGDLVWALLVGYPWWPSILFKNPDKNTHCRRTKPNQRSLMYNVEFLGYGERAWVTEKNVIPFEGPEKFEEFKKFKLSCVKPGMRKHEKKLLLRCFDVPPKDKKQWTAGVELAESLSRMEISQRCAQIAPDTSVAIHKSVEESCLPTSSRSFSEKRLSKRTSDQIDSVLDSVLVGSPHRKRNRVSEIFPKAGHSSQRKEGQKFSLQKTFIVKKFLKADHGSYSRNKAMESLPGFAHSRDEVYSTGAFIQCDPPKNQQVVDSMEDGCSRKEGFSMWHSADKKHKKLSYFYNVTQNPSDGAPVIRPPHKPRKAATKQQTETPNHTDEDTSGKENEEAQKSVVDLVFRAQKGPVCFECHEVSYGASMSNCSSCFRVYHTDCLPEENDLDDDSDFMCETCASGRPKCQICMAQSDETTFKCSVNGCKRFYHDKCVRMIEEGEKSPAKHITPSMRCPMHACHSCLIWDREKDAQTGDLIRCLLCSATYHKKDECIPAGCEFLSRSFLLCPRHLDAKEASMKPPHLNVDWCFSGSCKHGGTLVCCEQCPAAFHTECLGLEKVPEGSYLCVGCTEGKRPMFNDLVWAKIGVYRWWPAKVLHPLNVPDNIEVKPHSVGEFAVMFLGSHDYQYVSRGRVFAYCEGDEGTGNEGSSKHMNKAYKKALEEASEIIEKKKADTRKKETLNSLSSANEPPLYNLLKENLPYDVEPRPLYKEDPCDCNPKDKFPCSEDCSNRDLQIECDERCSARDRCCNKRFQRSLNAKVVAFKTDGRGWGLRALEPITRGSFVCEYIGELISQKEMKRRWKEKTEKNEVKFYFLTLDRDRTIDACNAGNIARFMNHSCDPNCSTQIWQVNTDVRVGLFADRDVAAGEELTFHYNMDSLDAEVKLPCSCGAKTCLGYIGKKQQKQAASNGNKKSNSKQQKKKKQPRYENQCFRCGDGGKLLCCDRRGCPKVYHLECLDETRTPTGVWFCPWHYCNECTRPAECFCDLCDNSYCAKHVEEKRKIRKDENGSWVCVYHHDEDYASEDDEAEEDETTDSSSQAPSMSDSRLLQWGLC